MTFNPQNWKERLSTAGRSIEERAQGVANQLAKVTPVSANIDVNAVKSSVEGSINELSGATLDLSKSLDGLTGPSLGNAVSGMLVNRLLSGSQNGLSGIMSGMFGNINAGGKLPNALDVCASYTYEFTLGCLSAYEVNFPDSTYRIREPNVTILRSSGGNTNGSRLSYETNGKTEYFMDDLEIESLVTPNGKTRLTNAVSINFSVTEPYSMGNFLQALQVAALTAGHKNYIEAPYCLIVQFKGWTDFGQPITVPNTRRVWPLKFVDITFDVNEGGSVYNVTALPYNEIALTDQNQSTHTDTQFKGRTISEMLQTGGESLTTILNNRELEKVEAKQISQANQYVIMFPKSTSSASEGLLASGENNNGATTASSSDSESAGMRELTDEQKQQVYESITGIANGELPADFDAELSKILGIVVRRSQYGEQIREFAEKEENINDIGKALMTQGNLSGGTQPMGDAAFAEDENQPGKVNRCQVGRSSDLRCMTASPGKKVQDIIEQVVLASEYGRAVVTAEPDGNGMVPWFKIEVQTFLVPGTDQIDKTGEPARIFVYRVVQYMVHKSTFQSPTQSSPGIANLFSQAVKEYNYIYTGLNKDIIDFDIKFDLAFFTSVNGDVGQLSSDSVQGASKELASGTPRNTPVIPDGNTESLANGKTKFGIPKMFADLGGINLTPENIIAMNFNEALVNSGVDLLNVDLTIVGDPYFISDTGMGNYNAQPAGMNITTDGTMSFQDSEVDIIINFRTPLDYGSDGMMDFPGLGSVPVKQFSGVYKVLFCKSSFKAGQYTNTLQTIRRRAQDGQAAIQAGGAVDLGVGENQLSATGDNTGGLGTST